MAANIRARPADSHAAAPRNSGNSWASIISLLAWKSARLLSDPYGTARFMKSPCSQRRETNSVFASFDQAELLSTIWYPQIHSPTRRAALSNSQLTPPVVAHVAGSAVGACSAKLDS